MKPLKHFACLAVAAIIGTAFPAGAGAEAQLVEAEGRYPVSEAEGRFPLARERAEQDALRKATEEVGLLVESYSEAHSGYLTEDEVRTIAAAILKVTDTKFQYKPDGDGGIIILCHIKAEADMDDVDLTEKRSAD